MSINCSVPDAITVSIVDDPSGDRSDFNNADLNEVRLNCIDGNAQVYINIYSGTSLGMSIYLVKSISLNS